MTRPASVPGRSAARKTGAADRWINYAAATTVAGLAGIAGALSYSHMRQLAQDHGQAGWHAHAFPLSVDGVEIVASLVLLADRRAGHRSGWLPWTALALMYFHVIAALRQLAQAPAADRAAFASGCCHAPGGRACPQVSPASAVRTTSDMSLATAVAVASHRHDSAVASGDLAASVGRHQAISRSRPATAIVPSHNSGNGSAPATGRAGGVTFAGTAPSSVFSAAVTGFCRAVAWAAVLARVSHCWALASSMRTLSLTPASSVVA